MKVWLKNELFPFHNEIIKNISIQRKGDLIAVCSGKDGDSMKLIKMDIQDNLKSSQNKINFSQIQTNTSIKHAINVLQWSPDDQYLAIAYDKLVVYKYCGDGFLQKMKEYQDHALEITCLSWSPDSKRLATGAMDRKIVVNDIQQEKKIFETLIDSKITGMIWDTYDKYISVLTGDNQVLIWKTNTFDKSFEINLNFPKQGQKQQTSSKREDRKVDWSSDYRYILVPSLDDKVVPVVCALDRNKNFEVSQIFMGPFSSINCVKFNPNLYDYDGYVINVFALGDNDGNISIWGIGEGFQQKRPFSLFKSHLNGQELIEDISWSKDGNVMVATTMKRYLFMAIFSEDMFGKRLSKEEQQQHLEGQYGAVRQISQGKQFKVFKAGNGQQQQQNQQIKTIEIKKAENKDNQQQQQQKQQVTFTEQRVIQAKDGKKRIIPSHQVFKKPTTTDETQNNNNIFGNNNNKMEIEQQNTNNNQQQQQNIEQQTIQIKHNKQEINFIKKDPKKAVQQQSKKNDQTQNAQLQQQQNKKFELSKPQPIQETFSLPISNNKVLQFSKIRIPIQQQQLQNGNNGQEEIQEMRIQQKIICGQIQGQQKELLWSQVLDGQVLFIERSEKHIYFYTDENLLYVVDYEGRKIDLPFIAHNVYYMKANSKGQVCMISNQGVLSVQDIVQKKNIIEEDIGFLLRENLEQYNKMQGSQKTKDPIDYLVFDDNCLAIIQFKTGNNYFFSQENSTWHKLDSSIFELGIFQNVKQNPDLILSSVNNNKQQQNKPTSNTNKFFELLMIDDQEVQEIRNNDIQLASKLEDRILFISKYTIDQSNSFKQQFLRYCKALFDLREINKFRQLIVDTFVNSTERYYIYIRENKIDPKSFFQQIQQISSNYPFVQQVMEEFNTLVQY